jgi:hypothetical protein
MSFIFEPQDTKSTEKQKQNIRHEDKFSRHKAYKNYCSIV